ncbi:hypothetical protein pdam_00017255 [Pocillopora damicornis]|uniref:Conodipine-M alpha chain n=2 Tax=Pocillopora TaxID=46730 RepID=A0A3M6UB26_POCDA|nr:hypothetical protein pdam_00017255 [Pocillopora damicornis]CAH3042284.1 unnamed protein product [Pocillopora meandrina]
MKVGTFLVFGILLVMSFYEEIQALCHPNGCSIPFNLPYFYKKRFTPACNKHDVCYACGESNKWSRYQCDRAFKRDMDDLCQGLNITKKLCRAFSVHYYNAVLLFGGKHYKKTSLSWCKNCPKERGDPNARLGR